MLHIFYSKQKYAIEDQISVSEYDKIKNPARTFDFPLDDFQKRSIIRLEKNKNILVCAHISSGKTVVAEYGIALRKRKNQKVIYTSPIKALSNQKYWEFRKKFEDVGIITGDVKINEDAKCLILTTEILHKYLYFQNNILNEVGTIIFDEVHYINDNERGHVWEEILIVLPEKINIIMLSATIPNYKEFASWIGKIKNTTVYIEITNKRVVPLQHFIYVDNDHIYKVKDKEEKINDKELNEAFEYLKSRTQKPKNSKNDEIKNEKNNNENFSQTSSSDEQEENEEKEINEICYKKTERNQKNKDKIFQMIIYLLNNELYPATLFVFNTEKIKIYSEWLIEENNLPRISEEEKKRINNFFDQAITNIPNKEKNFPQIEYIRQLLQYGLGVHHSGILPFLKEIMEILYCKGFIKILFATTSFSIGLNMPTKSVVFTDLYKFNDKESKMLTSNEYLQMSGRAGRRGVDELGNVYIICSCSPSKEVMGNIKNRLKGEGNDLESKFRLSYGIILSCYQKELKNLNDFLKKSFLQYHIEQVKDKKSNEIKDLEIKIENKKKKIKNIRKIDCKEEPIDIEDPPISKLIYNINKLDQVNQEIYKNKEIIDYLIDNPGTILELKNPKKKTNNNSSIKRFIQPELAFVINSISFENTTKFLCLTITKYDKVIKNNDSNNEINGGDKIYFLDNKNKGKLNEYYYKYLTININDIIEIYQEPKVEDINPFYKGKNKENEEKLNVALKLFYRYIITYFPKKEKQIDPKKIIKINLYSKPIRLKYKKKLGEKEELTI